jgi:hypothetical protein
MHGGVLRGNIQREYIDLCKKITNRDVSFDYKPLTLRILEIMYDDVISYINTLPDEVKPDLLSDIEQIYSTIDRNDIPFNCINIFALQITILFTKYHEDKSDPEKYHFFTYHDYMEFTKDTTWKTYNDLKSKVQISNEFQFLLSSPAPQSVPIFMAYVGFLRLGDLIESILNNVFFLALSYDLQYVDGNINNPMSALWHDQFHYDEFKECYKYPVILKELKEFRKYVCATKDASTQYAIHLTLFTLLHEEPYCYRFKGNNSLDTTFFNTITKEFIYEILEGNLDEFKTLRSQGLAIPAAYRALRGNSRTELNTDKIKEYLHKVADIYVTCYTEYQATKVVQGGGKRTRRTRKRRV